MDNLEDVPLPYKSKVKFRQMTLTFFVVVGIYWGMGVNGTA